MSEFSVEDVGDEVGEKPPPKARRRDKPAPKPRRRDKLALLLSDVDLWRSPDGLAHASVPMRGKGAQLHREHLRVTARDFRAWLMTRYFLEHGSGLSGTALAETVALAEARALASGEVRQPWRRFAIEEDRVYVDLGGGDPAGERRAVAISAQGWRIVPAAEVPVAFLRAADALPLPEPEVDAAACADLRHFVNAGSDDDLALVWAWLACAARPFASGGAYPLLLLHGEQGSGKSGATRVLQDLLDPSTLTGRALPRDDRDLFVSAANRHLCAFDNVSSIGPGFSDSLCRIATGGGYSARALHTDGDESIFTVVRPLLINGIPGTLLARPDLADRAIAIELMPLRERREEAALRAAFVELRPGLLGLLCDGLASALRNLGTTKIADPPRMMDACTWAEAAAPGLGIEPGRIPAAWCANRAAAARAALEVDDVALAAVTLLEKIRMGDILGDEVKHDPATGRRWWQGTPQALHARLCEIAGERATRGQSWPRTASGLGNHLVRIAPGLRSVHGIEAARGKGGGESARWWSLRRV
jgi:hypothetical protein